MSKPKEEQKIAGRSPGLNRICLRLADAEVVDYLVRFPREQIAAVRPNLFALQGHSGPWLNTRRVAG
jgi:hypothetical protein